MLKTHVHNESTEVGKIIFRVAKLTFFYLCILADAFVQSDLQ